jgi:hypothetical protein
VVTKCYDGLYGAAMVPLCDGACLTALRPCCWPVTECSLSLGRQQDVRSRAQSLLYYHPVLAHHVLHTYHVPMKDTQLSLANCYSIALLLLGT